jgi:hypothetical protein
LREAMERAQAEDEINGVDADDLPVRERPVQTVRGAWRNRAVRLDYRNPIQKQLPGYGG